MKDADYFAYNQYRDYVIYKALAKREHVPEFKRILEGLIDHEYNDYVFWSALARRKKFSVSKIEVLFFLFIREVFGLTFAAKFLEGRERKTIAHYHAFLKTVEDKKLREEIHEIIAHEQEHERQFISQIKEERVRFLGNIVLGLNDGLIELSGALVGFSFAFANPLFVALAGLIVGLAASFSMAASAYMQARHEKEGENPVKAALYTGFAYLIVVLLLVAPFFVFLSAHIAAPLAVMIFLVFLIVVLLSFYSSVIFERPVGRQIAEIALFSIGVAIATFALGMLVRQFIPELSA